MPRSHIRRNPKQQRPVLPITMADCIEDDDKTAKRSNGTSNHKSHSNSDQELSTPKPARPRVVQKQSSGNSTSGHLDSFHRSIDSLQFADVVNSSNNHHHDPTRSSLDHQHRQSFPLQALMEEEDEYALQADSNNPSNSSLVGTSHNPQRKSVKNAGKKVLQVAVTRPWKSVRRRLIGGGARHDDDYGEHSPNDNYGAIDGLCDPLLVTTSHRAMASSSSAAVGVPSEISATSFPLLGGSPLPNSVRGFLSPVASTRDPTVTTTMQRGSSPTESVLVASEYWLRCVVVLLLAFLLGAYYQQYAWHVAKVAEYVVVAWLTCVTLRCTAAWNEVRHLQQLRAAIENINVASDNEHMPLLPGRDVHVCKKQEDGQERENALGEVAASVERRCLVVEDRSGGFEVQHTQSFESTDDEEKAHIGREDDTQGASYSTNKFVEDDMMDADNARVTRLQSVTHPSLNPFFIVNTADNKRVFPNSSELMFPIDNDYFSGKMLALIRTPDADDEYAIKGTEENEKASCYFRGRQRRFDFQFEFRVKKIPKGRIYFMLEVEEPVKMGMIQRAFASAALAFVKGANPNLHYSISGTAKRPDGQWECPHIAFPIEEGMDRVVATPLGEEPPALGQEIFEDEAAIKLRKKTRIEWRTDVTYTLSLYSSYADFLNWRVVNLPGIKPFSISSLVGPQPIYLTLYEVIDRHDGKPQKQHYRCNTINILRFEVCNSSCCQIGPATKSWIQSQESKVVAANANAELQKQVEVADDEASALDAGEIYSDEESDNDSNEELLSPDVQQGLSSTRGIDGVDQSDGAAEELGEGIYLKSGDYLSLRELLTEDDLRRGQTPCQFANGGGFAVLQEQNVETTIVIEKAGKSRVRRKARASSKLIKSGDTVIFKLVPRGRKGDEPTTKYLSIHRGWWLKWVSSAPTKNGFFTIHIHETDYMVRKDGTVLPPESQSSYLTLGGSFSLRHKRWKQYRVGIASEPSTTYGGRMLGLHIPAKDGGASNLGGWGGGKVDGISGDEVDALRLDGEARMPSNKGEWMRPLLLQAFESGSVMGLGLQLKSTMEDTSFEETDENELKLVFSHDQFNMDVPAWVDVFNRTDRLRTHLYVVRVLPPISGVSLSDDTFGDERNSDEEKPDPNAFVRLRTGRDLAEVMRAGVKWRNSAASLRRLKSGDTDAPLSPASKVVESPAQSRERANTLPTPTLDSSDLLNSSSHSRDEREALQDPPPDEDSEISLEEWEVQSDGAEALTVENFDGAYAFAATPTKRRGTGRKLIGKIAKGVKTTTTTAARTSVKVGTTAARTSVKVGMSTVYAGKATVNAGKAIIPIRPKKPPVREPKAAKRQAKKHRDRGLLVDVKSRAIKRIERLESRSALASVLAGELCAAEQSCRSVSSMISKMSSEPESSYVTARFSGLLRALVNSSSVYDETFLQGGALQIGVTTSKVDRELGDLVFDRLVARCLWESHWREEWCGLYEKGVVFYAPLTNRPCLELLLVDIMSVRLLEDDAVSPLSGYPVLVIETAWLCHYCAFGNDESRLEFYKMLDGLLLEHEEISAASFRDNELAEARFWQGFQTSVESSHSDDGGKWAKIVSGSKIKNRTVLNNRRMVFDLNGNAELANDDANCFVEALLSTALSFSFDELKQHPEAFVKFLDSTSLLRKVRLRELDLESSRAFCFFVNLYHCLLQHALLCSANGPLHKRTFTHFMQTSCYEVGGDVFSLAELYSCVIRGNMSRPISVKPPYIEAPKKSSAYSYYALAYTNPNTNFLLNTADLSCLRAVPVLNPSDFEEQIETHAAAFIRRSIVVDLSKRQVMLPKVMEVYRGDFTTESTAGSTYESLRYCFRYMDMDMATKIRAISDDNSASLLVVKYHPASEQFYTRLVAESLNILFAHNATAITTSPLKM